MARGHLHRDRQGLEREWFYITEPRDAAWAAAPEFRSGPPARLASWTKKGLDWGSPTEVKLLQQRVSSMIKAGAKLTNVVQVMLCCRLLPCQQRAMPMWSYRPEDPATVHYFHGTTHEKLWKVLFKPQKEWPSTEEDIGLDAAHPPREVMELHPPFVFGYLPFSQRSNSFLLAGLAE
jgi:hypothetical protein